VSWGYKRLHVRWRRPGWPVNDNLLHRLYSEDKLALKRKRPKRRIIAISREIRSPAANANERWTMDLVHDVPADGCTIRILTVVDVLTRECAVL